MSPRCTDVPREKTGSFMELEARRIKPLDGKKKERRKAEKRSNVADLYHVRGTMQPTYPHSRPARAVLMLL